MRNDSRIYDADCCKRAQETRDGPYAEPPKEVQSKSDIVLEGAWQRRNTLVTRLEEMNRHIAILDELIRAFGG